MTAHINLEEDEHPFAQYVRILGKGKKGARPLTQDEAYQAMRMILADEVLPIQLGAFLMLMRIKEETPEELAGFVLAVREHLKHSPQVKADLDWSSYAGKRRHLPWFLLSALLLAEQDIKVLMHGAAGHTQGRMYTEQVLQHLGLRAADSLSEAEQQLQRHKFAYVPLSLISPALDEMIHLRSILGLRSPVHTLVRLINPFNADYSIQGIFHPSYRQVHQHAALLLGQTNMAVLKGEGGETERNPDMDCLVQSVRQGELIDETWPALFERRHVKAETLQPEQLAQLWRGDYHDEFAEAAVVGTAAVALRLLKRADDQNHAQQLAQTLWQQRDKTRFG